MLKPRVYALAILILGAAVAWFAYASEFGTINRPFKLGLDLSGGTHLVYRADISQTPASDVKDAMEALRDTIERRLHRVFHVRCRGL